MLGNGRFVTQCSPVGAVEHGGLLDQLLPMGGILLPPLVIGDRASVAQQIGIPVLAATDTTVARLEPTDTAFHVIIGAGELDRLGIGAEMDSFVFNGRTYHLPPSASAR